MTMSQRISVRLSEIRQALNTLAGLESLTDEQRQESDKLQTEFRDKETQYRSAVIADGEAERRAATDGEGAELRALLAGVSLGRYFAAAFEHRRLDGREAELQQHFKLAGNAFPVEMLRGPAVEHRAVTPAPTDTGASQQPIVQPVFAGGDAAFLGANMPVVDSGDAVFPVLTSRPAVRGPYTDSTAATDTTGAFSADSLSPKRLQASFFWRRTDAARFAMMGEALRQALSLGLTEALDSQVCAQVLSDGTQVDATAADTFATYRSRLVYGQIDGRFASMESDIRLLLGSSTLAHAAGLYRGNTADDSAADSLRRLVSGLRVSPHLPAVASSKQVAIVRRGMRMDLVVPVWRNVSLIPDDISQADEGQIKVTAILLFNAKTIRTAGFAEVETQHA